MRRASRYCRGNDLGYAGAMPMTTLALSLLATLVVLATIHAYWGLGGIWPAADARTLSNSVVGVPGRRAMPSPIACFLVALALLGCALWVALRARVVGLALPNIAMLGSGALIALIFLARGLATYTPVWRKRFGAEPFATFDRALYGPLCLLIGAGYVTLLVT